MHATRTAQWARRIAWIAISATVACATTAPAPPSIEPGPPASPEPRPPPPASPAPACAAPMRVRFFDVAQALAALVELPDGRRVLVDTGDLPNRADCGDTCARAHAHLLDSLRGKGSIDMLWITHQHADHLGGAVDVLREVQVLHYVDNGLEPDKAEVRHVHDAARTRGTAIHVVDPAHADVPIAGAPGVAMRAIVPRAWPAACRENPNDCSIGLRIDACGASILFLGDAEREEEELLDTGGPVTLLQVGHHGSSTSTSDALVARTKPKYAVISAGRPDEGMNASYCHPRASVIERLTRALGGAGARTVRSFDGGARCKAAGEGHWVDVPASDRLWATERDGDVVLRTTGDGAFVRE